MKFTLSWLKEFLDTDANLESILTTLTDIGLEVEIVIDYNKILEPFIIAHIEEYEKHEFADSLGVCKVNTGKEILQIVCGAPNARKGINVVLAQIGTIIPTNNLKIKKSKIRNVESHGMLCSSSELGIGNNSEGIIELDQNLDILGDKCVNHLNMNDVVIEIAITPNRGDCLGVYGIARDLATAGIGKLKQNIFNPVEFSNNTSFTIKNKLENNYYLTYIDNINNNIDTPEFIQNRLNKIDCALISPIVDIVNYVMFSFGQPMHVFDSKKINGNQINIQYAEKDSKFKAINDKEYILNENDIIIKDQEKIIAIAGIMGSKDSECDKETTSVILEVANFNADNISKTNQRLKINSDSSYRFERKIDIQNMENITLYTLNLIKEILNANIDKTIKDIPKPYEPKEILFSLDYLVKISGFNIDVDTVNNILLNLGFKLENKGELINITVPSWRNDINIQRDIVEEILRIYGYNNIPEIPINNNKNASIPLNYIYAHETRNYLASNGYYEVVNWSFMDSNKAILFNNENTPKIKNPIHSDLNVMRNTLISHLLDNLINNIKRNNKDFGLFELGNIFTENDQSFSIAGIKFGNINGNIDFLKEKRDIDFYDVKNYVADIISIYGINNFQLKTDNIPNYYHPYRSARIVLGNKLLGYIGELDFKFLKNYSYNLKNRVIAFELFPELLISKKDIKFNRGKLNLYDFQTVQRDFSFTLDQDVEVGNLIKLVNNSHKFITNTKLVDIYEGQQIENNKKSVSISIEITPTNKTLEESEINDITNNIINVVNKKFQGELRN